MVLLGPTHAKAGHLQTFADLGRAVLLGSAGRVTGWELRRVFLSLKPKPDCSRVC